LNELPEAKDWLKRAIDLRNKDEIKRMALADTDLAPLREFIQGL
jgi:hypothetical protein